eukprot:GDKI01025960.1.p1 GENE.GDKI01025960.1~~GDKI01025960.1.p1  ORF type:complete len:391 (+),score=59.49 GDKI01025960.1:64-1236(+)
MRQRNKFLLVFGLVFFLLATSASVARRFNPDSDSEYESDGEEGEIYNPADWYHDPSDINQVTDRVFISSIKGAQNFPDIVDLGITHIVIAAAGIGAQNPNVLLPSGHKLKHKYLDLTDSLDANLFPHILASSRWIEKALLRNPEHKVLVHCEMGISRSASVVLAYLMLSEGFNYDKALEVLQRARPIVEPNETFEAQLRALSETIEERTATVLATQEVLPQQPPAFGGGLFGTMWGTVANINLSLFPGLTQYVTGATRRTQYVKVPLEEFEHIIRTAEENYRSKHVDLYMETHVKRLGKSSVVRVPTGVYVPNADGKRIGPGGVRGILKWGDVHTGGSEKRVTFAEPVQDTHHEDSEFQNKVKREVSQERKARMTRKARAEAKKMYRAGK